MKAPKLRGRQHMRDGRGEAPTHLLRLLKGHLKRLFSTRSQKTWHLCGNGRVSLKDTTTDGKVAGRSSYPTTFRAALGSRSGNLPSRVLLLTQLSNRLGRTRFSPFPCHSWEVNSEKQVVFHSLSINVTLTVVWERMKRFPGWMDAQSEPVLLLFICSFAAYQDVNHISPCIKISFKLAFLLIQRRFLNINFFLEIRSIWYHRK